MRPTEDNFEAYLEELRDRLPSIHLWGTRVDGDTDSCLIHGHTRPHVCYRDLEKAWLCGGCGQPMGKKRFAKVPPPSKPRIWGNHQLEQFYEESGTRPSRPRTTEP